MGQYFPGRRKRGRPPRRFMVVVKEDMQTVGVTEEYIRDRVIEGRSSTVVTPKEEEEC